MKRTSGRARIGAAIIAWAVIAGGATLPALAKPRRPPRPTCEQRTSRLVDREAEWAKLTQRAFDDALVREQLTSVKLPAKALRLEDRSIQGVRFGATFTFGAQQAVLFRRGTMDRYGGDEFVQDTQGVIHPLVRKENDAGSETHTLCGCNPDHPGGVAPRPAAIIYLLPDGAGYGAPIELAYDARHVHLQYLNVVNGRVESCPLPP